MNRRWPAFILIPGLLLAVLVFDQRDDTERARRARPPRLGSIDGGTDLALLMPVGAPADALSSTWYCAGGTASEDGIADHAVVISNPTDRQASGTVTAVPSEGDRVTEPVVLEPYSRVRVTLTDLVTAPFAAAQVEFAGGQVAVEQPPPVVALVQEETRRVALRETELVGHAVLPHRKAFRGGSTCQELRGRLGQRGLPHLAPQALEVHARHVRRTLGNSQQASGFAGRRLCFALEQLPRRQPVPVRARPAVSGAMHGAESVRQRAIDDRRAQLLRRWRGEIRRDTEMQRLPGARMPELEPGGMEM